MMAGDVKSAFKAGGDGAWRKSEIYIYTDTMFGQRLRGIPRKGFTLFIKL